MITRRIATVLAILLIGFGLYGQTSNFPSLAVALATPPAIGGTTPAAGAFTTLSATGAITSTLATGSAPLVISSTTPVTTLVVANHPMVQFCGTTVSCSHTALTTAQVVYGSAALTSGTPSTAVITGISPAFTSSTSYKCVAGDVTTITNNVVVTSYASGSSFTVTGPATSTDTVEYICTGN